MRMNTRGRTGRTARIKFGVSVMCMALLLGASLPAGADHHEAPVQEAFRLGNGHLNFSSSCNGGASWVLYAAVESLSNAPLESLVSGSQGELYVCGERAAHFDPGKEMECWEGVRGTGYLTFAQQSGEVLDLSDVTLKRVYRDAVRPAEVVLPQVENFAGAVVHVPHFLVEGRYVRRSDRAEGQLRILIPTHGFYELDCAREPGHTIAFWSAPIGVLTRDGAEGLGVAS